jgi:hypothetical protein
MKAPAQLDRDSIMLETFRKNLLALERLPLLPNNHPHLVWLRVRLKFMIRELEQRARQQPRDELELNHPGTLEGQRR